MNPRNTADTGGASLSGPWIRIGRHAAFWLVALAAMLLLYSRMLENSVAAMWLIVAMAPLFAGAVYFTLYVTLPRALYPRRYWLLLQLGLYTLLGVIFLQLLLFLLLVVRVLPFPHIPGYEPPAHAYDAILLSAGPVIVTLAAVAVKLLQRARDSERAAQRLRQEKLEAELAMLRAQVHPHFLFNTLNNLYALTLKKSDQAPEAVLTLSQLLDYMLHESGAERVDLAREAEVIGQYLALERLRYGAELRADFHTAIETPRRVAPLLFLPLVENSFKHGVSRCGADGWVTITLRSSGRTLRFTVENSVPPETEATDAGEPVQGGHAPGGLGLRNLRARLALLYPDSHTFEAGRQGDRFTASITITFPSSLATEPA